MRDLLADPNPIARRARLLQGNTPHLRRSSTPCAIYPVFVGAAPRARPAGGPQPPSRAGRRSHRGQWLTFLEMLCNMTH